MTNIAGASFASAKSDLLAGEVGATTFGRTWARSYVCHYCRRSDGQPTRDHKIPKIFGGKGLAGNIVRCCRMCNSIKAARPYEWFVVLFGQFLEVHGEEYRAANPDERASIGPMARKFNAWLYALQHTEGAEVGSA
jgi:hypothetical protein